MTTIYLAKKLFSLKHSKIQIQHIGLLKKRNMRELAETKRSLQKINKHRLLNSCRLCLRLTDTNIFNDTAGFNIAEDIKNILNVEVRQNDGRPQYICVECVRIIRKAVDLKQVAEVTQWRLDQEAEMVCDSAGDDNVDDCTSHNDEEISTHHMDVAPKCNDCQNIPNSTNDHKLCKEIAKKPRRNHFARSPYICETCGLKLKTMWRLKSHMQVHTNEFNYSCKHCPYRSRNRFSLQIHERTHTGARPYICVQCQATFCSASNLASHRRSHLPPMFKCDVCTKGFKFKQPLLNHIATQHRNAKPFFCCECGSSFAIRKLLLRHERKIHNRPSMRTGATPSYIKSQENVEEPQAES